ncbi:MAG: zinc ABC transporter substrate-binding protein [Syntrophorhabdaceae bacterium]|nr:zinc ABC transporter substrate-binding protein [Syntrophorhabdaceae bacterium]
MKILMKLKKAILIFCAIMLCVPIISCDKKKEINREEKRIIITSDTLLAYMVSSILPSKKYSVQAILPPDQCPGHYDIKVSDIERIKNAELIIAFKGLPFIKDEEFKDKKKLIVDAKGHNWMSPDYYERGLHVIGEMMAGHYRNDATEIERLKTEEIKKLKDIKDTLKKLIKDNGLSGKKIIASSMQKELLEWMGFNVITAYGRPESLTPKEIVRLIKTGEKEGIVMVVDNLQSGPEAGKSIAEALKVPHVVLTNFPDEKGYRETLKENTFKIINALIK